MYREFLDDGQHRMESAVHSLEEDLASYRTGRASSRLLDRLMVNVYGSDVSIKQLATVSVPEPQQIAVRPYDSTTLGAIERAILQSDLGLTPNNDGKIIRLNIPRPTQQRRKELVKQVNQRIDEGKVAVRNVRRDVHNDLRDLKKDKEITEDDLELAEQELQKVTDRFIDLMEEMGKTKSAEIMAI